MYSMEKTKVHSYNLGLYSLYFLTSRLRRESMLPRPCARSATVPAASQGDRSGSRSRNWRISCNSSSSAASNEGLPVGLASCSWRSTPSLIRLTSHALRSRESHSLLDRSRTETRVSRMSVRAAGDTSSSLQATRDCSSGTSVSPGGRSAACSSVLASMRASLAFSPWLLQCARSSSSVHRVRLEAPGPSGIVITGCSLPPAPWA